LGDGFAPWSAFSAFALGASAASAPASGVADVAARFGLLFFFVLFACATGAVASFSIAAAVSGSAADCLALATGPPRVVRGSRAPVTGAATAPFSGPPATPRIERHDETSNPHSGPTTLKRVYRHRPPSRDVGTTRQRNDPR
jgi:hypothetical protein